MSRAYYNEIDHFAASWLRNLISAGLIALGDVDERSIEDVNSSDLKGYTQCHFFAGIGGWSYALRLAGWSDDVSVWTGSCPCQPFSVAGKRKGTTDKRHLWPEFRRLIAECKPSVCFGEQVASPLGRGWLSGVRSDMEILGYAVGAADLCAASVNAPHIRQRLYWVADSGYQQTRRTTGSKEVQGRRTFGTSSRCSTDVERVEYSDLSSQYERPSGGEQSLYIFRKKSTKGVGNSQGEGLQEQRSLYSPSGERCSGLSGFAVQVGVPEWNGPTVAVECSDGYRRVSAQPDAFPMAHGVSKRMGKLRGAGNAIVPQLAAEFIKAYCDVKV